MPILVEPASTESVQAWLDGIPGMVTIQRLKNNWYQVTILTGSISLCITRPTFLEAANVCLEQTITTSARNRASK